MSSPRQKMVVVAPPQPIEFDQKKRRQALERAKANHLSKQLQMRLQYAKLKVEHGWQRQNLNEVENLYFHHSHLRNIRQGTGQWPHYATVTHPSAPASASASMPASLLPNMPEPGVVPSSAPDRTVGPSPSALNDPSPSGSVSPPSEHASTAAPTSQPPPVAPSSTHRPPPALDLSDPTILARLAQLQAQVQIPSPSLSSQTLSRQPSTVIPTSMCTSASTSTLQPIAAPTPVPVPVPAPGAIPSHTQLPQPLSSHSHPGFPVPAYTPHVLLGMSTAVGSVPLYPTSTPHNATTPSQPSLSTPPSIPASIPTSTSTFSAAPTSASASATTSTASLLTMSIPTSAPLTSPALTYDSFWSTHASAGPTRALYRTHTGFSASATPGGNVAMLTPGGHAAVMTSEGVYVGGASNRNG